MAPHECIALQRYLSPYGPLWLGAYCDQLCLCEWEVAQRWMKSITRISNRLETSYIVGESAFTLQASHLLDDYFARRRTLLDLPLLLCGTPFQQAVWESLRDIPYGQTVTYSQLAQHLNKPRALRAVAHALGANPLSIFLPCHRVVGSNGALTGYSGGLTAKRQLLLLEQQPHCTERLL